MSFDRESETPPPAALNNFSGLHGHSLQMLYNTSSAAPVNLQRQARTASPAPPPISSPSAAGYPFPMYSNNTNNSYARYPVSKMPPSGQQQPPNLTPAIHPTDATLSGTAATSTHVARQLTYAQISRNSSSPHHHARTAAAMARNAPVASTVTITDPNNPNKTLNGLLGKNNNNNKQQDEDNRAGAKPASRAAAAAGTSSQSWTTLDMGGMGLKNLSRALYSYTFLTMLYINHNNLTYLDPAISRLTNLKTLDVSGNKLTSIPPELGLLINLRELLMFDNKLVTLPSELGTLYQLETLGLEGNPIQPEIKNLLLKEGTAAVILSLKENAPVGMPPPQREWITLESAAAGPDDQRGLC